MAIEVRSITKTFGKFTALRDVSFKVDTGRLVALLGPSGCGKTTLLRIIAGLETPEQGSILFDGGDATEQHARERRVGFVFQHYALFRHMNVFENIAFGLRVQPRRMRPPEQDIRSRVHELLSLVQLDGFSRRYPAQLSGGQRQRVALARALAVEPKVLLLDEPFGALDAQVRKELRRWLRRLHDELHMTSVFVTHDQEEALEVADAVVVMDRGRVEQIGTSEEVYNHPASPFVYRFLGNVNLFHGRVEGGKARLGNMEIELPAEARPDAKRAAIGVRPHLVEVALDPPDNEHFRARVRRLRPAGAVVEVELTTEWGDPMNVEISQERCRSLSLTEGSEVFLTPKEKSVFVTGYADGEGI